MRDILEENQRGPQGGWSAVWGPRGWLTPAHRPFSWTQQGRRRTRGGPLPCEVDQKGLSFPKGARTPVPLQPELSPPAAAS